MKNTPQETKASIPKRKGILILSIALVIIIIFVVYSLLSGKSNAGTLAKLKGNVYINEIMTNNKSYPDRRGIICDWAELYNSSNKDIDISGYKLADKESGQSLILPAGTLIPSGGYLLISFGSGTGEFVAPFGLSKNGSETLTLSNSNDQILDVVFIEKMDVDTVMVRYSTDVWWISQYATPLFENDHEKYNTFIDEQKSLTSPLLITEVTSCNLGSILDSNGNFPDWIELKNVSNYPVDLAGYFVSDNLAQPFGSLLPSKVLTPSESVVIFASGDNTDSKDEIHANFRISSKGETICLHDWRGIEYDRVDVPLLQGNYSYARGDDGDFVATAYHTPGYDNNSILNDADAYSSIYISEVCPVNRAGTKDKYDDWSDWIELKNQGDEAIKLEGCWLSIDADMLYQYRLSDVTILAGETVLIFASGREIYNDELHTNFKLSSYGQTIGLYTKSGYLIDAFKYPKTTPDISYVRLNKDDEASVAEYTTPGYPNSIEGRMAYMESITRESPLLINEVMTSNSKYIPQAFGRCYDWVELINASNQSINLADYTLSDDLSSFDICTLPDVTLGSGQTFIVICSGNSQSTDRKTFHADFVLSAEYSPLYLFDKQQNLVDWISLCNIPPDTSYGRLPEKKGFYHFEAPSPGKKNSNGLYGISQIPKPSVQGGTYASEDNLEIELLGSGDIFYTLDGTIPTKSSKKYSTPIQLQRTSVIRAVAIEPDMLSSDVLSTSYFLDVEHNLPIISLSVNPSDMFSDSAGIYVQGNSENGNYYRDWEKLANLTFYEDNGDGFSVDCGLRMHGGGSRASDEKKSLKVVLRPKYGQSTMIYSLFGENTPNEFSSLVIRAGEDYRHTVFRSELLSMLAKDACKDALTQDHKYCVLYVNGQYFGIFALMERYNEDYYAARYNVTPESVTIVDTINLASSSFTKLLEYCANHNMKDAKSYAYIEQRVDIDNLIDWCIMQAYAGNTDISYNVRIMSSTQGDGKWRYCLYDLDWTMRNEAPAFDRIFKASNAIFSLPKYLIQNDEFKQKFYARAEQLRDGVLSNENVLAQIEEYDELLRQELPADRKKWGCSMATYEKRLETLKSMVRDIDRWDSLMSSLDGYCAEISSS